jgi:hypothetical protein
VVWRLLVILCGIDPGVNNGFALKLPTGYITATFRDPNPHELWDTLRLAHPNAVAVETFYTGNRVDDSGIHTIEVVGSIRGICHILHIPCFGQVPQVRKSYVPDAKDLFAKVYGRKPVMTKDEDDHEISALSHLLCLEERITNGEIKL